MPPNLFWKQINIFKYKFSSWRRDSNTGKGANLALFGGAIMALCSRRTKRARLAFPDSFSLVHFFWRSKRNERLKEASKRTDRREFGEAK
jgi:hypothetical protein